MTTEIIRTESISKHYEDVRAVSDMSLSVGKGEIYGFLGLNGAGKTTTIRMLLGMIRPTAGAAYINGIKISADNTDCGNMLAHWLNCHIPILNLPSGKTLRSSGGCVSYLTQKLLIRLWINLS